MQISSIIRFLLISLWVYYVTCVEAFLFTAYYRHGWLLVRQVACGTDGTSPSSSIGVVGGDGHCGDSPKRSRLLLHALPQEERYQCCHGRRRRRRRTLHSTNMASSGTQVVTKHQPNEDDDDSDDGERLRRQQYFANRIAASRQRALLTSVQAAKGKATVAVLGTRYTGTPHTATDSITRISDVAINGYFAERIAESRKRALLTTLAHCKEKATLAVLGSGNGYPLGEALALTKSSSSPKSYFADRIAQSRQRALLTTLQSAKNKQKSTLAVLGGALTESIPTNTVTPVKMPPQTTTSGSPSKNNQAYFASRIAESRKRALLCSLARAKEARQDTSFSPTTRVSGIKLSPEEARKMSLDDKKVINGSEVATSSQMVSGVNVPPEATKMSTANGSRTPMSPEKRPLNVPLNESLNASQRMLRETAAFVNRMAESRQQRAQILSMARAQNQFLAPKLDSTTASISTAADIGNSNNQQTTRQPPANGQSVPRAVAPNANNSSTNQTAAMPEGIINQLPVELNGTVSGAPVFGSTGEKPLFNQSSIPTPQSNRGTANPPTIQSAGTQPLLPNLSAPTAMNTWPFKSRESNQTGILKQSSSPVGTGAPKSLMPNMVAPSSKPSAWLPKNPLSNQTGPPQPATTSSTTIPPPTFSQSLNSGAPKSVLPNMGMAAPSTPGLSKNPVSNQTGVPKSAATGTLPSPPPAVSSRTPKPVIPLLSKPTMLTPKLSRDGVSKQTELPIQPPLGTVTTQLPTTSQGAGMRRAKPVLPLNSTPSVLSPKLSRNPMLNEASARTPEPLRNSVPSTTTPRFSPPGTSMQQSLQNPSDKFRTASKPDNVRRPPTMNDGIRDSPTNTPNPLAAAGSSWSAMPSTKNTTAPMPPRVGITNNNINTMPTKNFDKGSGKGKGSSSSSSSGDTRDASREVMSNQPSTAATNDTKVMGRPGLVHKLKMTSLLTVANLGALVFLFYQYEMRSFL